MCFSGAGGGLRSATLLEKGKKVRRGPRVTVPSRWVTHRGHQNNKERGEGRNGAVKGVAK